MKRCRILGLLLIIGLLGGINGLSINSRASSGTSDVSGGACHPSPCGVGATCEVHGGLTVCKCPEGQSGDPFSSCLAPSSSTSLKKQTLGGELAQQTSSHQMTMTVPMNPGSSDLGVQTPPASTHYFVQTTETLANGGGYEVDYSRVPMRGESTITQRPAMSGDDNSRIRTPSPLSEGITVASTGSVFLSPQVPFQRRPEEESGGGLVLGGTRRQPGSSSNSFLHIHQGAYIPTEDPLGVFQRCRSINGIVVCADNSDTNSNDLGSLSANFNIPVRNEGGIARPAPTHHHHQYEESHMNVAGGSGGSSISISGPSSRLPTRPDVVSSSGASSDLCKTMCGINSVCRLVLGRPVCGCPEGTTGDPSVRCEGMEAQNNRNHNMPGGEMMGMISSGSMEMCSRHTECKETEICVRGQCSDPCRSTMDAGGMCGENSKCVVLQHTPLCGCQEGFTGNPYQRCTRIA